MSRNATPSRWVIALGANVAAPAEAVALGWLACVAALQLQAPRLSRVWATEPAETASGPTFANAVGVGWSACAPVCGLDLLHAIEGAFGRDRGREGFHGARPLDLDIVDIEGIAMHVPALHLPHPRWHQRAFVAGPVLELLPDFVDAEGRRPGTFTQP